MFKPLRLTFAEGIKMLQDSGYPDVSGPRDKACIGRVTSVSGCAWDVLRLTFAESMKILQDSGSRCEYRLHMEKVILVSVCLGGVCA